MSMGGGLLLGNIMGVSQIQGSFLVYVKGMAGVKAGYCWELLLCAPLEASPKMIQPVGSPGPM